MPSGLNRLAAEPVRSIVHLSVALGFAGLSLLSCRQAGYQEIEGFSSETNQALAAFFVSMRDVQQRKVAVFDGDGTTMGQTPHYLADECLFEYAAAHPDRKADVIKELQRHSNVSMPYVQLRVKYLAGLSLEKVRALGQDCFDRHYKTKVFPEMKALVQNLKSNGFEVWIVTASPESLYQQFLSRAYNIPITNVIGVRSIVRDGIITEEILHPVPQDHGKKEAIESFIQARPQLVGGNSRGDKEMIEFASHIKLIINPDTHVGHDQSESIAEYAKRNGWLSVSLRDVPASDFPAISSGKYGTRLNKTKPGKQSSAAQ